MRNGGDYGKAVGAVKSGSDKCLIVLGHDERVNVLWLTHPSPAARARFRRFAARVVETPSFPVVLTA